jgi:hypothetical protein
MPALGSFCHHKSSIYAIKNEIIKDIPKRTCWCCHIGNTFFFFLDLECAAHFRLACCLLNVLFLLDVWRRFECIIFRPVAVATEQN